MLKLLHPYILVLSLTAFVAGGLSANDGWAAATVDNSIYAELLTKYVNNGQVDYEGFKREEQRLDQYLHVLKNVDPKQLSRNEQFAFYTNAYNAWTIKLILSKYPDIDSIRELGIFNTGPWKKNVVSLKGEKVSLDDIEHDILRPGFKDPRVHFAINCAAHSCPPLRSEPYYGARLDQQLDGATIAFINNPKRNYLDGNRLYVSKIFDWFAEDFNHDPYSFVLKFAEDDFKEALEKKKGNIKLKYLPYDWSLNNKPQ
ncbi:MAG: DUF547 domain-containing protein [Desulfobacterales bacterium]|jgi:hypothetical protein